MKTITLVMIMIVGIMSCVEAQTSEMFTAKTPFSINIDDAIDIGETWIVEGKEFKTYELEGCKYYFFKAISAKGKQYPVWLYPQTEHQFEGNTVHKTDKGKYCYYKLSKSGYPYPVWLQLNE